jgi:hypothetical protein
MLATPPERPIVDKSQDILERQPFVERLANALLDESAGRATGVTIGLTGTWGSGKSSLLNLLRNHLNDRPSKPVIVSFDPWLVSGRHDLISEFLRELVVAIRERVPDRKADVKDLAQTLSKYASRLAPAIEIVPFIGKSAAGVAKAASKFLEVDQSLATIRESLFKNLQTLPHPIVVLIDEVDRVEDNEIRTVAQLVRSVADFPGISYVLAYDVNRVADALGGGNRPRGLAYLEKIVQLQIPLPVMFAEERARMVQVELKRLENELRLPQGFEHLPRYRDSMVAMTTNLIATPRDIKRVIGTFRALRGMVREEVDWLDLLGYCVVLTKYPSVAERVRENVDSVVSNPGSVVESIRRDQVKEHNEKRRTLILGPDPEPALTTLVIALFPSLSSKTVSSQHPDPICERRPLLTVLRLGLIPGAWSRERIAVVFDRPAAEVSSSIHKLWSEDELGPFFDRLDDVFPSYLSKSEHFWLGVSDFLSKKGSTWLDHYIPKVSLTKDFAELLLRATRRDPASKSIAKSTLLMLSNGDDIALVAEWLRAHIFEHGLHGREARHQGDSFMSRDETEQLADQILPKWRKLHLAGELLTRLFGLVPVYAIQQAGLWDDDCRRSLTSAFDHPAAVYGFSLLAFGPEYVADARFIAEVCDVKRYRHRLKECSQDPSFQKAHESAQHAVKKAADVLEQADELGTSSSQSTSTS